MTDDEMTGLGNRMDGDYEPPILAEPVGGPIPEPDDDEEPDDELPDDDESGDN